MWETRNVNLICKYIYAAKEMVPVEGSNDKLILVMDSTILGKGRFCLYCDYINKDGDPINPHLLEELEEKA